MMLGAADLIGTDKHERSVRKMSEAFYLAIT